MSHDDIRDALRDNLHTGNGEQALAFEGRWYDWNWMALLHRQLDAALSHVGLQAGAPIALISRNRPQHVAAVVSILAATRTTCMIYGNQSATGLAGEVKALRAPAVVADESDWSPALHDAVRELGALGIAISSDATAPVRVSAEAIELDSAQFKPAAPEVAVELLSSGTTGRPKRVALKWSTVSASVQDGKAVYASAADQPGKDAPTIMINPLGNISGLAYAITPMVFRKRVVLLDKFELRAWLDAVRTYLPQRVALPPAAIRMILDADIAKADLSSLKIIGSGGSALSPQWQAEFEEKYGIPIVTALGATEFGGVVANWTLDLHRQYAGRKRGSVGRSRPGVALRVVDPQSHQVLSPGQIGLLEAQVDRIGPDWIRTTDLASLDQDGFLYLHGRADSAINRGGFKIAPETIANALAAHPALGEVVVVALADERLGQVPAAAVEVKPEVQIPSESELMAFARDKLLSYQMPVRILAVHSLPRNASMKASLTDITRMLTELQRTN